MAAIGTGWADGAWVFAAWIEGAWSQEPNVPAGGGAGAKKYRAKGRWVVVGGKRYKVFSPEEERRLLEAYMQAQARLAAASESPVEAQKAQIRVRRTAKRLEKVESARDAWIKRLMEEDEEILVLLH